MFVAGGSLRCVCVYRRTVAVLVNPGQHLLSRQGFWAITGLGFTQLLLVPLSLALGCTARDLLDILGSTSADPEDICPPRYYIYVQGWPPVGPPIPVVSAALVVPCGAFKSLAALLAEM